MHFRLDVKRPARDAENLRTFVNSLFSPRRAIPASYRCLFALSWPSKLVYRARPWVWIAALCGNLIGSSLIGATSTLPCALGLLLFESYDAFGGDSIGGLTQQSTGGVTLTFTEQPASVEQCLPFLGKPSGSFTSGPGGCVVSDLNGPFAGPWTYSDAAGSWSTAGQAEELGKPPTTFLECPEFVLSQNNLVGLRLVHRYDFEFSDGLAWDGGQVQMSVNGGPFAPVSPGAFLKNGYTGEITQRSRATLAGQPGFMANSPGYETGTMIVSRAQLGNFQKGDRIRIRLVASFDTNTRAGNPAWEVRALEVLVGSDSVDLSTTVNVVNPSFPSSPLLIQWQRSQEGGEFVDIPGATGTKLHLPVTLADNGACFRVLATTPGLSATSQVACLTLQQPNTPPSFQLGANIVTANNAGAVTNTGWASQIQAFSTSDDFYQFVSDFSGADPGIELFGAAKLQDGVLKLVDVGSANSFGHLSIALSPARNFDSMQVSWRSLIGGGFMGADGYSFNLGTGLPSPPAFGLPGEEGAASGLSVTVDTFENSVNDVGIEIRWNGQRVAYQAIPSDDDGSGRFLRKDAFVDASLDLSQDGIATFTYDGNKIDAALPHFKGLVVDRFLFSARTGGASDNHWIDDLRVQYQEYVFIRAESTQHVEFLVETDRPDLFTALPALSSSGDLTYTPNPAVSGRARVLVTARDDGGIECQGSNQSETKTFFITTDFCPTTHDVSIDAFPNTKTAFALPGKDADSTNLTFKIVSAPLHGLVTLEDHTGIGSYVGLPGECGTESLYFTVSDGVCTADGTLMVTNGCPPRLLSCPASTTIRSIFGDPEICGGVSNLVGDLRATGFPEPTVTCRMTNGTIVTPETVYPIGTSLVICTASNRFGTSRCEFSVTVIDRSPPIISVRDWIVVVPPGVTSAEVPFVVEAMDPCDGVVASQCEPVGPRFPLGTTTVQCTATDRNRQLGIAFFRVVVTNSAAFTPVNFDVEGALPGVANGVVTWADFDQDGRLDLLLSGHLKEGSNRLARLYRNASNTHFAPQIPDLPGAGFNSVSWADYDLDGDVDLVVAGGSGTAMTQLFRNEGGGVFTAVESGLPGVLEGSVAWGDFDQDGRPDLVLVGSVTGGSRITRLFRNCPGGGFVDMNAPLPGLSSGRAAWADFDRDGRLDLALIGWDGNQAVTAVFRGNGEGGFSATNQLPVAVRLGSLAWGDWNGDGFPDLAVLGQTKTGVATSIYRNDPAAGGKRLFTRMISSESRLPDVGAGDLAWADFNNDGRLDLAIAGSTRLSTAGRHSGIYLGDGEGRFSLLPTAMPDVDKACLAAGDFDNDGKVDLLVAGDTGTNHITQVFLNRMTSINTPPTPPQNLSVALTSEGVVFGWNTSTDSQTTNPNGLSYQVQLRGPAGQRVIVSPNALANGRRLTTTSGNVGQTNRWVLRKAQLPTGVYTWSVQAVDPSFAGSTFSTNATFGIEQPVLDPIQMLPGGGARLTLSGSNLLYRVEGAADLLDCGQTHWVPLGTTTPLEAGRHSFIDANAQTSPYRFYRLVWP